MKSFAFPHVTNTSVQAITGTARTISSDSSMVMTDAGTLILVDASLGPVTYTLMEPSTAGNMFWVEVQKVDASENAAIIVGGGAIIGEASIELLRQYETRRFRCNGLSWTIVAEAQLHHEILHFGTRDDAVASDIPVGVDLIQTFGYAADADGGGATYRRVGGPPAHDGGFQSADGAWWDIVDTRLDLRQFGAVGDGTTDARDALATADDAAAGREIYLNEPYAIASDLSVNSLIVFGPDGQLIPASGVTVTLAAGFTATPTQHIFDISLGGDVWATRECPVTARNYGAAGNNIANDRLAFQHLIDCRLYFQKAEAVHLDGGVFFISGGPLIVNYGAGAGSIAVIGAGHSYDESTSFPGTYLRTDYLGNLLEVQGARGMQIEGIGFEGPFKAHISATLFGNSAPAVGAGDPYDLASWLTDAGNEAGALLRYKMCCGIHVDPRCGTQPATTAKPTVRLVVTSLLADGNYEESDVVQGESLNIGDRILQAVPHDVDGWPGYPSNGVYEVHNGAPPTRVTDLDAVAEFPNATVTCLGGDHVDEQWVCNNHAIVTLGTSNIDFRRFDGTLSYEDYDYPAWTGIVTQYGKALSSAITVGHCIFRGFGAALAVKGCNAEGNGDFVRMEYCGGLYNVYTFVWGQTQARDQGMVGCQFNTTRTHVSSGVIGRQTGKGHFKAVNSEFSGCLDILDIPSMTISGGVSLDTCYGEGCYRIGRAAATSTSCGGFEISGGSFGFHQQGWNERVPRWIIDCRVAGVVISPSASFSLMYSPLVIWGNPANCHISAKVINFLWQTGAVTPATIDRGDAILMHSTMQVLFLDTRQGPWTGGGLSEVYSISTGGSRVGRYFGRHATSSVSEPIPFCAATAAPAQVSGFDACADPMPVALGRYATAAPIDNVAYFTTAPVQSGRSLTLVLAAGMTATNVGHAQNAGFVPGSIIYDPISASLFVITTLSASTITGKLLNNYNIDTLAPYTLVPSTGTTLYFVPTGHYMPNAGVELTWTSASASVTMVSPDGATAHEAQFPAGAAKMVNNATDALTPCVRANSGISSSVAGTITMSGTARRSTVERAGIYLVPRP